MAKQNLASFLEHPHTLVLLDVPCDDLGDCLTEIVTKLSDTFELSQRQATHLALLLERHHMGTFEAASQHVGLIHRQAKDCPPIEVFIRFKTPLRALDDEGKRIEFLWLLISDQPTHPWIAAVAEFVQLMHDETVHQQILQAPSAEAIREIYTAALDRELRFDAHIPAELRKTGRLFGGIIADLGRRLPLYRSDFSDGLNAKGLATTVFLFFACIAPAIAFGGLLSVLTQGNLGAVEMLVATALSGIIYALVSGQPLTILGSTGPVIIFLGLLYSLCQRYGIPFFPAMAWVGLWTMLFLIILAITDSCSWIRYFTRFTDDTFAGLIAIIFIYEALRNIVGEFYNAHQTPDRATLSLLLALGTYMLSTSLSRFRQSDYLRARAREFLADFGPTIAIAAMTLVAFLMHMVDLETLAVPTTFSTSSGRPWLVNPFDAPTWVAFAAALPALLVSILLYLDQNITVRLVNAKQHKLKKGAAYHLDLLVVALLVGLSSLFGLPWMVAATVRSLTHVRALARTETVADREGRQQEVISSVVETRLTGLLIHLLIGASLFFLNAMSQIPMSVLFGLFLFMGVGAMRGNQLFERLRLWVLDPERYPPTYYLRAVPTPTVHRFTVIQVAALTILWLVKASSIGILFPLFIGLLVPLRMLLSRFFRPAHLALLDAEEDPEQEQERFGT